MTNTENEAPELAAVIETAVALDSAVSAGEPLDITDLVKAYGAARQAAQDAGHSLETIEAVTAGALD